jgi:hypothetical protein
MCAHLIPRHFVQNLALRMVGFGHGGLPLGGEMSQMTFVCLCLTITTMPSFLMQFCGFGLVLTLFVRDMYHSI